MIFKFELRVHVVCVDLIDYNATSYNNQHTFAAEVKNVSFRGAPSFHIENECNTVKRCFEYCVLWRYIEKGLMT